MLQLWRSFTRNSRGSVATIFSIAAPLVLGTVAVAIDSASYYNDHSRLQEVADSAALATAREFHVNRNNNADVLQSVGKSRAEAMLGEKGLSGYPHTVTVGVDDDLNLVTIDISMNAPTLIPAVLWRDRSVDAKSQAKAFGQFRLCVLGLDPQKPETLKAEGSAVMNAPDCSVQSNSGDPNGIAVKAGAKITSTVICSSGGVQKGGGTLDPEPRLDCPALDDPLASRTPPGNTSCDFANKVISVVNLVLVPGVYCGGIKLDSKATVLALPGVYVIKGGKLDVKNGSTLYGENVSFYFADDPATFNFDTTAVVDLTAPKDGTMAGMLFFENPSAKEGRDFAIKTPNAKRLLGTIYLPKGTLNVDAKGSVAQLSAYTVIVARKISIKDANLVVNADYGGTDVPVPAGLGPSGGQVRLLR